MSKKILIDTSNSDQTRIAVTDNDKLELYDDTMESPFIKDFRLYTLLKLYDFKGKTVLDCPCSTGEYTKIFLEKGAKYVLSSDIVPEQIDFAKKN